MTTTVFDGASAFRVARLKALYPGLISTLKGGSVPIEADKSVHRQLQLSSPLAEGPDVRALQQAMKGGLHHFKVDWLPLKIDSEFGFQTVHAATFYAWILGASEATHRKLKKGTISEAIQEVLRNPEKRGAADRDRADSRTDRLKEIRKAHKQGPKAAAAYAKSMIDITEDPSGSNSGPNVTRKGKKGGISFWESAFGQGACFWCLCFACYCVRDIGGAKVSGLMINAEEVERMAKAHSNGWVEVSKTEAKAGDIALFCFDGTGVPDHGELVVGPFRNGISNDVGGNTSSEDSGSQTNGGGVFAKRRDLGLLTSVARPLYG